MVWDLLEAHIGYYLSISDGYLGVVLSKLEGPACPEVNSAWHLEGLVRWPTVAEQTASEPLVLICFMH